jgi:hypothetical protein
MAGIWRAQKLSRSRGWTHASPTTDYLARELYVNSAGYASTESAIGRNGRGAARLLKGAR